MIKSAIQGIAIFVGMQFLMGQFMGKKSTTTTTTDASGAVVTVPANTAAIPPFIARPDHLDEGATYNPIPQRLAPIWPLDSSLDITIVVSPTFVSEPLAKVSKERIVVQENDFKFGNYTENRVIDTSFGVPKEVKNNGTLWGHFYIALSGNTIDPSVHGYDPTKAYHFVHPLTQYIAQKKIKKTKNLLAATNETETVEPYVPSYWKWANRRIGGRGSPNWTNHQLSLPPELHHVFHSGFWRYDIPKSSPCCSPICPS
jgi:hypothetical protein